RGASALRTRRSLRRTDALGNSGGNCRATMAESGHNAGRGIKSWSCGKSLEEADDVAVLVEADLVGGGHLGQSRHGHDLAGDDDDELGAGSEPHLAHRDNVAARRAL